MADDSAGVRAIDISDPRAPFEVDTDGPFYSSGVSADNQYVYAVGGNKLRIYPIAQLPSLNQIGSVDITNPQSVAVDGHLAVVATYNGLQAVDVSDPGSPILKGFLPTPEGPFWQVDLVGTLAYVAEGSFSNDFQGLRIIDLSSPNNPTLLGSSEDLNGTICESVAVFGNYAYVTTWDGGLHVLDVLNPANPSTLTSVNLPGTERGVAVSDALGTVFVASSVNRAFDISLPASPVLVDSFDTLYSGRDLAVAGSRVFIVDQTDGMTIPRFSNVVSGTVPIAGTQLVSSEDNTTYTFPANVFTDTVVFSHTLLLKEDVPPNGGLIATGHLFEAEATYSGSGLPAQPAQGQTFTITIDYDPGELAPATEDSLALYRWDSASGKWTENGIEGQLDIDNDQLVASISHLSQFGMFGDWPYKVSLPIIVK